MPTFAFAMNDESSKAVILAYHRIDEQEHTNSSISFDQFAEHVTELKNSDYTVLPLDQIISAFENNQPLPPKTIAITFEGGYRSIYYAAIPLLIENELPFTIFIASENTKIPNYLNWKDLKKIKKYEGVSFGTLPANYIHLSELEKDEITRLINKSRKDFKKKMGFETKFFSYPYGEISNTLKDIVKTQGFKAAFGLQSGASDNHTDPLSIPRFSMTEDYADLDRFRMITNTLPLDATEIQPEDFKLSQPLSQIGFTLNKESEESLKDLSCHISGQEKPRTEILGNRVEIIPNEPITGERTRLNCTLPVSSNDNLQWKWLGMLFH